MKQLYFLCLILVSFSITSLSQSCLPEGITFTSQAQIDSFQLNYPGCTEIEGNVSIVGGYITNLNGLVQITSIDSTLRIGIWGYYGSTMLTTLEGLNNLSSIGGNLIIEHNDELQNVNGLNNLTTVAGDIQISANYGLTSLSGFSGLEAVGGDLKIWANPMITNIAEFESLTSIGGSLIIDYNSGLKSLNGLNHLAFIGGSFTCRDNYELIQFEGLDSLIHLGGNLELYRNTRLQNIAGLTNLASIGENLMISSHDSLISLMVFPNESTVNGGIDIHENVLLQNLIGLEGLQSDSLDYIYIFDNPQLSFCNLPFICDFLANPAGKVIIYDNAGGCDDPPEIAITCGISLPCLPYGDYIFRNQADIDNFQNDYPGCTQIEGNVAILGADITNLDGLYEIISIDCNLQIGDWLFPYPTMLTSLSGLDNLETIGGDLIIESNSELINVNGLENLSSVEGDVIILSNSVSSISDLSGISHIGGDLEISSNDELTGIPEFVGLTLIGGSLIITYNGGLISFNGFNHLNSIGGSFICNANSELNDFYGLDSLLTIGSDLFIESNEQLSNLSGMSSLTSIGGDLMINWHQMLDSLDALSNLSIVSGGISIEFNDALTSLTGLDNIDADSIDYLYVHHNPELSVCNVPSICEFLANPTGKVIIYDNASGCDDPPEIANNCGISLPCLPYGNYFFLDQSDIDNFQSDYEDCTQLEGNVQISGTDISNLQGLNGITSISGGLSLWNNPILTHLYGLENLAEIGGDLYFGWWEYAGNNSLMDMSGLENLISIGGELFIHGNNALASLTGLNSLESIGQGLTIFENQSLISLDGLESLDSIGGWLTLNDNPYLADITGLWELNTIGGTMGISNNDSLSSLSGLDNIDPGTIYYLDIRNNDLLSTCEVKSICELITIPGANITISGNAPGCNSQEEVEAACGVGIAEILQGKDFVVFPNPSHNLFTIGFTLDHLTPVSMEVINRFGQVVDVILNGNMPQGEHQVTWNAERMPTGIYFYRFTTGKQVSTGKLVIAR